MNGGKWRRMEMSDEQALTVSEVLGTLMRKGSLQSRIPVVSRSAPPLHGKPSRGELSSPSQSSEPCSIGCERMKESSCVWMSGVKRDCVDEWCVEGLCG